MDEFELRAEFETWKNLCATATGWPSAYMAASELTAIEAAAKDKGFDGFTNPHKITKG